MRYINNIIFIWFDLLIWNTNYSEKWVYMDMTTLRISMTMSMLGFQMIFSPSNNNEKDG